MYWVTNQKKSISLAIHQGQFIPSLGHILTCSQPAHLLLHSLTQNVLLFTDSISTLFPCFSGVMKIAIAFLFTTFLQ